MSKNNLVSIVTPVYNTEEFLEQCIKSVLQQTYENFEYIILDNCSTDGTAEIIKKYADQDNRIKTFRNDNLLNQVSNFNEAVRYISDSSKYCKMVLADDFLYPACIEEMVRVADSDESIGLVGAFTLLDFGDRADAYFSGLPYPDEIFDGGYICRRYLADNLYVFGSPSVIMLRSDYVRSQDCLFDENTLADDTDLCMKILTERNFGFCYQVLTYTRRYNESIMTQLKTFEFDIVTRYLCLKKLGRRFFNESEFLDVEASVTTALKRSIGEAALRRMPPAYWEFLNSALSEVNEKISGMDKLIWMLYAGLDLALNPKSTIERLLVYYKKPKS